MITVKGSTQRSFIFPAAREEAFHYYADTLHTLGMLTHIHLVERYSPACYSMLYNTLELGMYPVRMYCYIESVPDTPTWVLRFQPWEGQAPVKPKSTLNAITGQGYYHSQSVFIEQGNQTRIDYSLHLEALLPPPLTLRFVPGPVLNRIAHSITNHRIHEIADGFIARSIEVFQQERGLNIAAA